MKPNRPERLIIRPPSEWRSLLLRVTRGCAWNRCKFCGIYPSLGEPNFSMRSVEEVKSDIDLLKERFPKAKTAFLGDSDPLHIPQDDFIEILKYLRSVFPKLNRVTCYARATTLWKKKRKGIVNLAKAGLNRVHIGLESGDTETLRFHRKGQTPEVVIETGNWLKQAGIEVSYYILLGLGGKERWKEHIDATVDVIQRVDPEFVRLRRIWLYRMDEQGGDAECPLWKDIRTGRFQPQLAEGTVLELRRLIEKLRGVSSFITCDHANNYVQIKGRLPDDRHAMLEEIDRFMELPEEVREEHYEAVGSQI